MREREREERVTRRGRGVSPYVQGLVESGDEGFIAVVETVLVDSLIRLVLVRRLAVDPEGKIQTSETKKILKETRGSDRGRRRRERPVDGSFSRQRRRGTQIAVHRLGRADLPVHQGTAHLARREKRNENEWKRGEEERRDETNEFGQRKEVVPVDVDMFGSFHDELGRIQRSQWRIFIARWCLLASPFHSHAHWRDGRRHASVRSNPKRKRDGEMERGEGSVLSLLLLLLLLLLVFCRRRSGSLSNGVDVYSSDE